MRGPTCRAQFHKRAHEVRRGIALESKPLPAFGVDEAENGADFDDRREEVKDGSHRRALRFLKGSVDRDRFHPGMSVEFLARMADLIAEFGGSWKFIGVSISFTLLWVAFNSYLLLRPFDVFPYVLLNLVLGVIAGLQAPIIMMSQNRSAEKDRLAAEQDFKVNLKSELMLEELVRKQRARDVQIDQLNEALKRLGAGQVDRGR